MHAVLQELGKAGDGYLGKKSPHTVNEIFTGLELNRLSKVFFYLVKYFAHCIFWSLLLF